MVFRPDFSHGVGHAADQQGLLAHCRQLRHEQDLDAQQEAFERVQALSGSVALMGEAPLWVPGESDFDRADGVAIVSVR